MLSINKTQFERFLNVNSEKYKHKYPHVRSSVYRGVARYGTWLRTKDYDSFIKEYEQHCLVNNIKPSRKSESKLTRKDNIKND